MEPSSGNQASTLLAEDPGSKEGSAMLIRGEIASVGDRAAMPAASPAIPAASRPTLLLGGLLLLIGP